MPEVTVKLADRNEALLLFGSRDQHLRRVRDALGIKVVARNGDLQLEGTEEQLARGAEVFRQLRDIVQQRSLLTADDVQAVLDSVLLERKPGEPPPLDVFSGVRQVRPRTDGQARYVQAMREHDVVFCIGPAGTGKTYLAVARAVNGLREGQIRKIVLVRPAVEAGEKLGFLPGDIQAKVNPYLRPLLDALREMMDYEQIRRYMDNDLIEIIPLAYMRGRTLNESVIILDEGQNTTVPQMKMFLTRMGQGSKIIVTGDVTQVDLPHETRSGLIDAARRLTDIEGVATIHLNEKDIVRHRLVQAIVRAYSDDQKHR